MKEVSFQSRIVMLNLISGHSSFHIVLQHDDKMSFDLAVALLKSGMFKCCDCLVDLPLILPLLENKELK